MLASYTISCTRSLLLTRPASKERGDAASYDLITSVERGSECLHISVPRGARDTTRGRVGGGRRDLRPLASPAARCVATSRQPARRPPARWPRRADAMRENAMPIGGQRPKGRMLVHSIRVHQSLRQCGVYGAQEPLAQNDVSKSHSGVAPRPKHRAGAPVSGRESEASSECSGFSGHRWLRSRDGELHK